MRIAVIADIHANGDALHAVLERIHSLTIDEIVCLGDIVGYNADPNECVDVLKNEQGQRILGNHDAVAAGLEEPDRFTPLAHDAILWTRDQLTGETRQFLLDLPREEQVRDFFLFHGFIHDTNRYLVSRDDALCNFRMLSALPTPPSLAFFGHTHVQKAWSEHQGSVSAMPAVDEVVLVSGRRYLINPGSVGQPRDGDPRAAFLVYDDQDRRVSFYRVAYDIPACQNRILRAGLPPQLAERLAWGR
jgi:diadenosine tetraphosphatase ApaH/serine/threonine PP2A family protein phosphatase